MAARATHQEKQVLKKTGIIVSAATAGVLALGGFAFATTPHHEAPAPVNHTNISQDNVGNDCEFGQQGPATAQDLAGGNSLLGVAGAVTGAVAPITAQTQALDCTNLNFKDLVDSGSNNDTRELNETTTRDSGNVSSDED
jgi:hypothetical protein